MDALGTDGYILIANALTAGEVNALQAALNQSLTNPNAALIQRDGLIVGARNLLRLCPEVASIWQRQPLFGTLAEILGRQLGLVRVLYFDKPPSQTWSLPWHKDLTIAVSDNRRPASEFRNPTTKAGVPHVEASRTVLESMLFARCFGIDALRAHSSR